MSQGSPSSKTSRLVIRPRTLPDRATLLDMLAVQPALIEPGLRLLERDLELSPRDCIEMLVADRDGRPGFLIADLMDREHFPLTAADLRVAFRRARPLLERIFVDEGIRFDVTPRALFIASRFTPRTLGRIKGLRQLSVEAYQYHCIEVDGQRAIYLERIHPKDGDGTSSAPEPTPPRRATSDPLGPTPEPPPRATSSGSSSGPARTPAPPPPTPPKAEAPPPGATSAPPPPAPPAPSRASTASTPSPATAPALSPAPERPSPTPPAATSSGTSSSSSFSSSSSALGELHRRARSRIMGLSDEIRAERGIGGRETFRWKNQTVAEISFSEDRGLEIGTGDGGTLPRPIFSNTDFEDALGPIIRRFFALLRKESSTAATKEPPPKADRPPAPPLAESPAPRGSILSSYRPVPVTEEEINEIFRDEDDGEGEDEDEVRRG